MQLRSLSLILAVLLLSSIALGVTPQVVSTNPMSGPTGSQVQINGSGFGGAPGTVKFNGAYPASIVTWSDSQIVVTVPAQAFTGPVVVTAGGIDSNQTVYFNIPAPQITAISPTTGGVGTQVTINGSGFQNPKGAASSITFNGISPAIVSWNDTQIIATVAANTTTGAIKITVNGVQSNQDQIFTLPNPVISGLIPSSGAVGTSVQINGSGFGAAQGSNTIQFNGVSATTTAWSDSSITATVPTTATSGPVLVAVGGVTTGSNVKFTVPPPLVTGVSPAMANIGTSVTVTGSGFQAAKGSSSITFNGATPTTITTWSDSQIVATIPSGTTTGPVKVVVNSIASNQDVLFTVPSPLVTSISPVSGPVRTPVTVNGSGFGATQGSSTLQIAGWPATVSTWSDNRITASVPDPAGTGNVVVTVAGVSNRGGDVVFTVPPPVVTSVSPASGPPGTTITITGTGFRASQTSGSNNGSRAFSYVNGQATSVSAANWSDTQIVTTVPAGVTTGPVWVTTFSGTSNANVIFTLPNPIISSLSPSTATVGTQIQINGSGFGSSQGVVNFGNVQATGPMPMPWNDNQILVNVPTAAVSAPVTVTANGVVSNANISFTIPPPHITSISPTSGIVGTAITINGSGFQTLRGSNFVGVGSATLTNVTWSDTQIVGTVPSNASTNFVRVTVNGTDSNKEFLFTMPNPLISGFSPSSGPAGNPIQISGSGFGATQAPGSVAMIGPTNISVSNWTDNLISGTVPTGSLTGAIKVTVGGITATAPNYTVANLSVNTFSPLAGPANTTSVTVTGTGFGSTQGTLSFNNVAAQTISSWTDTQIVAKVPATATTGPVKVTVGGSSSSSAIPFTVGSVVVSGVSPTAGLPGTTVNINGSGFGSSTGSVAFNGTAASIGAWSDNQITATVPNSVSTGPVKVTAAGISSNTTVNFTVSAPIITSISPASGIPTDQIQIHGSGFGTNQGTVNFNSGVATIIPPWTDTTITATVPVARSGPVTVTVGGISSNSNVWFTFPDPQVTSISPPSGVVGTPVTVHGSGFGASPGTITINGVSLSGITWSDTAITGTVASTSRTGPVKVNARGVGSNTDVVFSMPNPIVNAVTPISGPTSTLVHVLGSGFGGTQNGTVTFNGKTGDNIVWSDTSISANIPSTASAGPVAVTVGGVTSNTTINFLVPPPQVTSITPNSATPGSQVVVTGSNFQQPQGSNSVLSFSGFQAFAPIVSWNDTQIVARVPSGSVNPLGPITVTVNGVTSNGDTQFALLNPRITNLTPASGPVNSQVQLNGTGFGATQGSSTVAFAGHNASVVSWSDTQILATVPSSGVSGAVTVSVNSVTSNNNINFTVPAPRIASISPTSGVIGTTITINGSGFQSVRGTGSVNVSGNPTVTPSSWTDTQIVFTVPPGTISGAVKVIVNNGDGSNQDIVLTMPNPIVAGLVPSSGPTGTSVQINGAGFGTAQGSSSVTFNNAAASVTSWSDTRIVAVVPLAAASGPVQVTAGGVPGNANINFNIPSPTITSITPAIGGAGNAITITGTGFQPVQGSSSFVAFSGSGGGASNVKSWSDAQIVAIVPPGTTTGFLEVTVNNKPSNFVNYTIPNQSISTITPGSGPVGTQVTINGTAFGSSQGTSVLSFNGQPASVSSWTNTQIIGTVPVTAVSGPAVVTVGGVNSNTALFTVPPPSISATSPSGGIGGTAITITGSGFQTTQRDSTITFNGVPASVTSWSDTQIVANVPSGASSGPLLVTVNAVPSQTVQFEIPHPAITTITPPEAPAGGTITITGSGFGPQQWISPNGISVVYVGSISLNGVQLNVSTWSDTSITATLPSTATSGSLTVTKFNATSNASPFTVEGAPAIAAFTPSTGPMNGSVVISGSNFGSAQYNSTVQFNGSLATVTSWSDSQITAIVPPGTETGPTWITIAGVKSPSQNFTVNTSAQITDSLGRSSSYTAVMIGGSWLGSDSQGSGCSSCTVRGTIHNDYDPVGNLLVTTDELLHKTDFTYDANGNVASQTAHLDANTPVATSYTYNSFGEPLTVTDPLGNVTTNTYDANGNLLTVTSPKPDAPTAASVTQFAYDTKGQLTTITDPLNHITTLAYYPTGLIHTITDAQSNVTTYEYDLRGNRTAVVDAQQNRTTFVYDLGNRLTGIAYPDTTSVSFAYDGRGRRTSVTDQNGKVTSYAYDDADRLTSVTDAALNVTHYAYDLENNLTSITDAAQHTTSFVYDAFGRVTQTAFPSALNETYAYDAVGNLTSKVDRKNQTILYVYDALNRLTHKGYPDATGVDYVYDLAGKINQVSDPSGTYGFAYDNMGRLIGTTTQYSFLPGIIYSNAYGYDVASNRTSFTAPDGSTNTYAYDTLNRLSTLTNSLTGQFGFSYDALSRRTALNRPNGVNTSYSYDSLSRLLNVLHKAGTVTLDGAGYTYDNAGNRAAKTNYLNNITEQYTYDPLYQLTQVTQGATTTESYSYDAVGNRLSSLGMSPYVYNSSNELTSTPAATFTYDGNGNTLTKADSNGTTTYNWDFENRLASVVLPGSAGTVTFKYDPFGRRMLKSSVSGSTSYLYDGVSSLAELDLTGNLVARYVQSAGIDEPLAELRSGTAEYYEQDGLGSVTSLTNSTSVLANTYGYDSFGNTTASTGTFSNPLQYTGRETDSETSLQYYRARYHDSQVGRFISEDPERFAAGINFYPYVLNNPVRFRDPSGKNPFALPLPWWLWPTGEGILTTICFESGVCETVIVVGGVVVGVAAITYLAYDALGKPNAKAKPSPRGPKCEKDCAKIKLACIDMCSETTLPTNNRSSQGFPFFNCLNKCMEAAGCLGK